MGVQPDACCPKQSASYCLVLGGDYHWWDAACDEWELPPYPKVQGYVCQKARGGYLKF